MTLGINILFFFNRKITITHFYWPPDGSWKFEDIEVLENVRNGHEPEDTKEAETDPCSVEEDTDEHGWNGEVVNEGADLEHKVELVGGGHKLKEGLHVWRIIVHKHPETDPDEEVDHEADIECEIHLLRGVLVVWNAVLNSLPKNIC